MDELKFYQGDTLKFDVVYKQSSTNDPDFSEISATCACQSIIGGQKYVFNVSKDEVNSTFNVNGAFTLQNGIYYADVLFNYSDVAIHSKKFQIRVENSIS